MTGKQKQALKELIAAGLGGVVGALATKLLERAGLKRGMAALGVTATGGVAAMFTKGAVRAAATGVAASGAGQLVSSWFGALDKRLGGEPKRDELAKEAEPPRRNEASLDEAIERAFLRKRAAAKPKRSVPKRRAPEPRAEEPVASAPPVDNDDGPLIIKEPIGGVRVAV